MRKSLKYRQKLVPLRRFADSNLYSVSYLSLLVQRKKLKAEKVGRNYYTTEEWFKEYLEKHSQNEKWGIYQEKAKIKESKIAENKEISSEPVTLEKNLYIKYKTTVLTAVVFVLFIISGIIFYLHNQEKGQVAGTEEVNTKEVNVASTTVNVIEAGVEIKNIGN